MIQNEARRKKNAANKINALMKRKKQENTIGFKRIENENDILMESIEPKKKNNSM